MILHGKSYLILFAVIENESGKILKRSDSKFGVVTSSKSVGGKDHRYACFMGLTAVAVGISYIHRALQGIVINEAANIIGLREMSLTIGESGRKISAQPCKVHEIVKSFGPAVAHHKEFVAARQFRDELSDSGI